MPLTRSADTGRAALRIALKLFGVGITLVLAYWLVLLAIVGAALEFEPAGVFYGNKSNDLVGYGFWFAAGIVSPFVATSRAFRPYRKPIAILGAVTLIVGLAGYVRFVSQLRDLT